MTKQTHTGRCGAPGLRRHSEIPSLSPVSCFGTPTVGLDLCDARNMGHDAFRLIANCI
mgnify:CR=1 FL=1